MIVKISALLFWATAVLAMNMNIEVNISKDKCRMAVGQSRYEKPIHLKSLEKMTKVTLFYIEGQETFFGVKSWGSSVHSLKPHQRVEVKELPLTWKAGDANLAKFVGRVTMAHLDGDTADHLDVKTIYVSEEELLIYIGERKYFQLFLLKDQGDGSAKLTFGKQSSLISMADFEEFRRRTLQPSDNQRQPDAPQPPLVKTQINSAREVDFRVVRRSDKYEQTSHRRETSQLHWFREKAAFVVVKIGADDVKGARIVGLSEPRQHLVCEIFESNPFFLLKTELEQTNNRRHLISISQDVFVEDLSCPALAQAQTFTISRRLSNQEIQFAKEKHPNEVVKTGHYMGTTKLQPQKALLEINGEDLKEVDADATKDPAFDFSVLMGKEDTNVDLRLTREVNNRAVFFKVWTPKDATFLQLYTLDRHLKVVIRQFNLGKVDASRIRLWSTYTSTTKARKSLLNLVRKIRLHTNMFASEDFCRFLEAEPLVNKKYIRTPSAGQSDYGYLFQLSDIDSRLDTWQIYSYVEVERINNPEDSSGLGDSLNLVLYDPRTFAVLTLDDTSSVRLTKRSSLNLTGDRLMLNFNLSRLSSGALPGWQPSFDFTPEVQIVTGGLVKVAKALSLRPDSPNAILFQVRHEHHPYLNQDMDVLLRNHRENNLSLVLYSTLKNGMLKVKENKLTLTFRHKSVEFDAAEGFGFDGNLRVIYKAGNKCFVVNTYNYGETFDFPEQNFRLIDMSDLRLNLKLTQFFQPKAKELVIVLRDSNDLPLTDDQFKGLEWKGDDSLCFIPTESELKFEVSIGGLSILHKTQDIRYVATAPGNLRSEVTTYKYGSRDQRAFGTRVLPEVDPSTGQSISVLTGSVVDLNDVLFDSFFSSKASSFTYPAILLRQEESLLHLDFAHTKGKLKVEIQSNKVVFVISDRQTFEFHLSRPSVVTPNPQDRFFKLRLQLLVQQFESVEAVKEFSDVEGLNLETFEADSFVFSFEIDANVADPALHALAQRLSKSNPKFAFAAYVFQSEAGEATLLVYEQNNFVYKKIVDGTLFGEFDGPNPPQTNSKLAIGKKLPVNPKFFKNMPDYLKVDQDMNIIVSKSKRPTVVVESRSSVPAFGNNLCNSQKCWTVAVYPQLGGTTIHLITRKGEIEEASARGADLTIRGSVSAKRISGLPAIVPSKVHGFLV